MSRLILNRATKLHNFSETRSLNESRYYPSDLWHIYLKLDFDDHHEKASKKDDAKSFLSGVGRAAYISEIVAKSFDGMVVEVQGSMLHIALPSSSDARDFAAQLHDALTSPLDKTAVKSWRMAAQSGLTLLVDTVGIHNDSSIVSLGNAANSAAKHLYKELAKDNEGARRLKQFHLAIYETQWKHEALYDLAILVTKQAADLTRSFEFDAEELFTIEAHHIHNRAASTIHAQAAPVEGKSGSPANEDPTIYFGWTMRADLDGFTKRVEACRDNPGAMRDLAERFRSIMQAATRFSDAHPNSLVQLPWAGDNYTAAVVFENKDEYEDRRPRGTVEFSLDFDEAIQEETQAAELSGWAQAVGGDTAHGNAGGNIYLGSVVFKGRRFLMATGIGVGYTLQAFVDVEIGVKELAIYEKDYAELTEYYKEQFHPVSKHTGETSSLFKKGSLNDLERVRDSQKSMSDAMTASVSKPVHLNKTEQVNHSTRPYYR